MAWLASPRPSRNLKFLPSTRLRISCSTSRSTTCLTLFTTVCRASRLVMMVSSRPMAVGTAWSTYCRVSSSAMTRSVAARYVSCMMVRAVSDPSARFRAEKAA
uniref:Uncharacterized protein n=3 Tax=Human herpesvirus 1 TaxID=10298 RepID=A0A2Z4H5C9_HHV1|nr:hypothetical protein [Human alphaherpesvirus 1]AWW09951.1 hypothetical protein [Human alphaherpesvirus 1]